MKLTLPERFAALKVLPTETNFTTLKIVRDLQDNLALTEKETKDWEVKAYHGSDGQLRTSWNEEGSKAEVAIKIGEKATDIIVECLKALDKQKKLTLEHVTLYEKFIKD